MHQPTQTSPAQEPEPYAGSQRAVCGRLHAVVRFFVGLHQPSDARHFDRVFISANRLHSRKSAFPVAEWMLDSGAFSELALHGGYRHNVREYAKQVRRWKNNGKLVAAVAQDWMCEPRILRKTGKSVHEHQRLTIERYDELLACDTGAPILPVLQGYAPADYLRHLDAYGERLKPGAYVGVGSVCKRNTNQAEIFRVLNEIKDERPDLLLHGFGLKSTALASEPILELLHSADSMAWSFAARRQGRNANDWREAAEFERRIIDSQIQGSQITMRFCGT